MTAHAPAKFIATPAHEAIFRNIGCGGGHTVIQARAGSGKTTTILKALEYVPAGKSTLFVAFNKSIATELEARAPRHVKVSTLHSYGLRTITRCLGRRPIEDKKLFFMAKELLGGEEKTADTRRSLCKLVSLARGSLIGDREGLDELIDRHEIVPPESEDDRGPFLDGALKLLEWCLEDSELVDFDDMIWLPVVKKLNGEKFDRVFVDECQDLNAAQIKLALSACKPGGRICAVGDPAQAIYAFRGADTQAIPNLVRELDATVLPLNITYRCCKAVVEAARQLVPDFEAGPNNPEGKVGATDEDTLEREARAGDFILSRTNAPLMKLCMHFIRSGQRATIQGRDIGTKLAGMVTRSKSDTIEELREWVQDWMARECARLVKEERDTTATEDTAACLLTLAESSRTVQDVYANIERLFADGDDRNRIVLSSTHKAKGLEREKVWLLFWTYMKLERKGVPVSDEQAAEEKNLFYVAITRAKNELVFVHERRK